MNEAKQMALSAPAILMTERNIQPSLKWLRSAGLDAPDFPTRCYFRQAGGVGYSIVSNADMKQKLQKGNVFGLMGADCFDELPQSSGLVFDAVANLSCRRTLFLPKNAQWDGKRPLTVATSYPVALKDFAKRRGIALGGVVVKTGKVEGSPASGETEAGYDITDTEATLRANGLKIVARDGLLALGGTWRKGNA